MKSKLAITITLLIMGSCTAQKPASKGTYGYDVEFFEKEGIEMIQLKANDNGAAVLISPGYQGRIMTSTSRGMQGQSFGWINHDYISSGKINDQFNPFGGEERIWLGPEGGPFSIYFDQDEEQNFGNWRVPKELDTSPFELVQKSDRSVQFQKSMQIPNASGHPLKISIDRTITLLDLKETEATLSTSLHRSLDWVAYESENILSNKGDDSWDENSGFLSIWLLSMFNPSEEGLVFLPFQEGSEEELGKIVEDNYFGKVPEERLIIKGNMVYFKVDGKHRSKIGLSPERSTPYSGSYDPTSKTLTILWYSKPKDPTPYVNSKWGEQEDPLKGDALNSYNDGPVADGSILGPFYEIESSSPAALLQPGESIKHSQRIIHITGEETYLNEVVNNLFQVSLTEMVSVFEED